MTGLIVILATLLHVIAISTANIILVIIVSCRRRPRSSM